MVEAVAGRQLGHALVRDRVEVSSESSEDELVEAAKSSERVQSFLDGKQIRQTVVVPGKLVNLVVA